MQSPINLFSIKGKNILITGGLGLLGSVFCTAMLEAGATIYCVDIAPHAEGTQKVLSFTPAALQEKIHYLQADITKPSELERIKATVFSHISLDVLINNAALNPKVEKATTKASTSFTFETMPLELWERELAVNLTGTMLCCQTFSSVLAKNASVINVASIYGVVAPKPTLYPEGFFKPAAYGVSKAGVINLSKYLAVYWAKRGIRVNCVVFGGVQNGQPESFITKYSDEAPLGRMATPSDFVGILTYLASQASSYSTGAVYHVDGGWTAV